MDTPNLLRAYHRALSEARTKTELANRSIDFLERHKVAMPPPASVKIVREAHRERVAGKGSPALCDEALAKALKEIA